MSHCTVIERSCLTMKLHGWVTDAWYSKQLWKLGAQSCWLRLRFCASGSWMEQGVCAANTKIIDLCFLLRMTKMCGQHWLLTNSFAISKKMTQRNVSLHWASRATWSRNIIIIIKLFTSVSIFSFPRFFSNATFFLRFDTSVPRIAEIELRKLSFFIGIEI